MVHKCIVCNQYKVKNKVTLYKLNFDNKDEVKIIDEVFEEYLGIRCICNTCCREITQRYNPFSEL